MTWKTLQHNGILFPDKFESQGIKIKIKGQQVELSLLQEEMIYQWAKKKDTPYVQDKVFQKNFTDDFAKTFKSKFGNLKYSDIDFSQPTLSHACEQLLSNLLLVFWPFHLS